MPSHNFSSSPVIELPDWITVTDEQAARLLTDLDELRLLQLFFADAFSASEAAQHLGLPLDRLYFRLRRAEKLGILYRADFQKRGGSPIVRYRMAARGFFVPQHVIPQVNFHDLAIQLDLHVEQQLISEILQRSHQEASTGRFGLRIFQDDHGKLILDGAYSPECAFDYLQLRQSAVYSMWSEVSLSFEEALALRAELEALRQRQTAKRGAERYLLRLALAPIRI